ncbi:MAG: hypothetical protein V1846_01215 [Candidatus Komeilibacteria bacterium]
MSNSAPNVPQLLQTAHDEGTLSTQSLQLLSGIRDIGAQIQNALGVPANQVESSEVLLVSLMPDDSGSIRMAGNSQHMRDGHNLVIEALQGSKESDSILWHTRYLNGHVLNPYCSLDRVVRMDISNFDPNLGTPLYDETVVFLGTVLTKAQEFIDAGVAVRTISLIISDGADCHSQKQSANTVRMLVRDMMRQERHIVAAMGIDDGGHTDFHQVFEEMGIDPKWIFSAKDTASGLKSTASDIRQGFQLFSRSAVRASQSAASFSQTALGGFGG